MQNTRRLELTRAGAALALTMGMGLTACGDTIVQEVAAPDTADDAGGTPDAGVVDNTPPPPLARPCETAQDCDNGLFCDGAEECKDERCVLGEPVDCSDGIECTRDFCSDEAASCIYYGPDADGDGHADVSCIGADEEPLGDDCDDTDSNRFPGNVEFCDDGHDEDCDLATVGIRDLDRDGFTDFECCNAAGGERNCGNDCDDTSRGVNPDNAEVCDGFDNDCDLEVDEGLLIELFPDNDADLHGDMMASAVLVCPGSPGAMDQLDCDDGNITVHGAQVEICDLEDNDCDGIVDEEAVAVTWYFDLDGDGFGNAQSGTKVSCVPVVGASLLSTDCDDGNPLTYPNAPELCDARDNDCDGERDYLIGPGNGEDDDGDGRPDPACLRYPEDCNDDDPSVYPGATELCDGIDNDCNGLSDANAVLATWFRDDDGDGFGDINDTGLVSCEVQPGYVRILGDCDDGDATRNPGAQDGCAGRRNVDEDCDGVVDEDEVASPYYPDFDLDGFGDGEAPPFFACSAPDGYAASPADCNDDEPTVAPGADEFCAMRDGIDNDCDGDIDCEDSDCQNEASCAELFSLSLRDGPVADGFVAKQSTPITLVLKDQGGVPVVGQEITFTASEGAVITPPMATTDASGEVQVQVRPGRAVATYTFTARQADVTPFVFTVNALRPPTGHIYTSMNTSFAATYWPNNDPAPVPATIGPLYNPASVATAADGTTYVATYYGHRVFEVTPRGEQRPFAGTGQGATADDGMPAIVARIYYPTGLLLDEDRQRLYIAQGGSGVNGRIRVVDLQTGLIDTFAGGNELNEAPHGDGGSAKQANIGTPRAMTLGPDGTVYFPDDAHDKIRSVDQLGIIRSIITPTPCGADDEIAFHHCGPYCDLKLTDDGGAFLLAFFCGKEMGYAGNYGYPGVAFIPDLAAPDQGLVHVAGQYNGDTAGTAQGVLLTTPSALELDPAGDLYISDYGTHRVRRVDSRTTLISNVVGVGTYNQLGVPYGDYAPATDAELYGPYELEFNDTNDLRIVDYSHHAVRVVSGLGRVVPTNTAMEVISGQPEVVYPGALLSEPLGVRLTNADDGSVLVDVPVRFTVDQPSFYLPTTEGTTDIGGILAVGGRAGIVPGSYTLTARANDIRGDLLHDAQLTVSVVEPDAGSISTIVNSTHATGNRIGPPATTTLLNSPQGFDTASDGTIYIVEYYNHRVIRLMPEGIIEPVAGGNGGGANGDGGLAVEAQLYYPEDVVLDEARDLLYIVDSYNHVVRVVDLTTGLIDLHAGGGVDPEGPALTVKLNYPNSAGIGPDGMLYISDGSNQRIVRMPLGTSPANRLVESVLEQSACAYAPGDPLILRGCSNNCYFDWTSGDDMVIYGQFCGPETSGYARYMVALMDGQTGELSAVAGAEASNNGFGTMPAPDALFGQPGGLFVDDADNVYVSDRARHVVRFLDRLDGSGTITSVIGTGTSGSGQPADQGEWGPADEKLLYQPGAIGQDADGRIVLIGSGQHAVYRVW